MLKAYKAYVDASGTGDPDLLVLAGYVAPTMVWEAFSNEWQERLDRANLRYFKMKEMASRPEIAAFFYRTIEEFKITAAISCVIHTKELVRAVQRFDWPAAVVDVKRLENPYFFGFRAITDVFAQHQKQMQIDESVDFIFDDESEKVMLYDAWDWMKLASRPNIRKLMGSAPLFLDDKIYKPLQAADLYAWWVRKWQIQGIADGVDRLRFPWGAKYEIPRLHMEFREEHFLADFAQGIAPAARERWAISDPKAALRDLERREEGIRMTLPDPSSPLRWRT